jgi:hypothetical protein
MPSQFFVAAGAIRAVRGVLIRRADAEGSPRRFEEKAELEVILDARGLRGGDRSDFGVMG